MELNDIRNEIDKIDDEIAMLLDKRFALVEQVAAAKIGINKQVRDTAREESILARVSKSVMHADSVSAVFKNIFSASRANQTDIILKNARKNSDTHFKAIKVINGVNLNMLGIREPDIYGDKSYSALEQFIENSANELNLYVSVVQFNHEGDIVDEIQNCLNKYDGIIINPGAYTHTSVAIADALKAVNIPVVEVHLSDVDSREPFRKISYIAPIAIKTIKGHGFEGYKMALETFKEN